MPGELRGVTKLEGLTVRKEMSKITLIMRESPSGKASAFQADIRGFESRLPLYTLKTLQQRCFFIG